MVVVVDDDEDDEEDVVDDDVALMLLMPVDVIWFGNDCCGVIGDDVVDDGSGTDVNLKTCLRLV